MGFALTKPRVFQSGRHRGATRGAFSRRVRRNFSPRENPARNRSKDPRAQSARLAEHSVHELASALHERVRTHESRRCMPAGVIDISKYAMADRSQSVCWYERLCSTAHTATNECTGHRDSPLHPSGTEFPRETLWRIIPTVARGFPPVDGQNLSSRRHRVSRVKRRLDRRFRS